MNEPEKRLGRGLESLISGTRPGRQEGGGYAFEEAKLRSVAVATVEPNPFQPRQELPDEGLEELMSSMSTHGLLQPITVRARAGKFQIIAGERRWRAARRLGWSHLEAHVVQADDRQMLEWALIENVQREDLGPLELAQAYRDLQARAGLTQEELAKRLGQSRSSVANILRLLELPDPIKAMVSRGTIAMGAARALLAFPDPGRQEAVARDVAAGRLTVRDVESLASKDRREPTRQARPQDPNLRALAEELQGLLATRVRLRGTHTRGRLVIDYASAAELDALVRRMRRVAEQEEAPEDRPPGD